MRYLLLLSVLFSLDALAADSLFATTNLAEFGVPDVLADEITPYDERVYEVSERVNGKRCCLRQMYRVDGTKIVLLSHQGDYFLAFMITDAGSRMFFADQRGVFTEHPIEKGGTWTIPDWLEAKD